MTSMAQETVLCRQFLQPLQPQQDSNILLFLELQDHSPLKALANISWFQFLLGIFLWT